MKMPVAVISKPVQTPFGFHIIRVIKRELKDMSNYEKDKVGIENGLKKKLINEEVVKSEKRIRDVAKIKIDKENINKLFAAFKRDSTGQIMMDSLNGAENLVLASSNLGKWTIEDVIRISKEDGFGNVPYNSPDGLSGFIDRMAFFKSIYEKGRRMGANMRSDFKKDLELKMAIMIEQQVVTGLRSSVQTDDTLLVKFYNANISRYTQKGRVGIYMVVNEDLAKVKMVQDSLAKNKDFRHFAKIYSTIKPKEFSKPDYYIYTEDDTTGYYKMAMSLGKVNKVSDIFNNSAGYNLIKLVELVPPKPIELTESFKNGALKNDYIKSVTDSIINAEYQKAQKEMKYIVYKDKYEKLVEKILSTSKEK
jgi:hypothetical protein